MTRKQNYITHLRSRMSRGTGSPPPMPGRIPAHLLCWSRCGLASVKESL